MKVSYPFEQCFLSKKLLGGHEECETVNQAAQITHIYRHDIEKIFHRPFPANRECQTGFLTLADLAATLGRERPQN